MVAKNSAPDIQTDEAQASVHLTRLKHRREFLAARDGARSHERAFVLQMNKRDDEGTDLRIGFTVTEKVGNSVERNRIRRRLREAVKHAFSQFTDTESLAGFNGVLIARRDALTVPFATLTSDIDRAMHRCLKRTVANHSPSGQKRSQRRAGAA